LGALRVALGGAQVTRAALAGMMARFGLHHATAFLLVLPCFMVQAADIYRSVSSNGEERYATQAFDASYHLYLRDETPPIAPVPRGLRVLRAADAQMARRAQALAPHIAALAHKHAVDVRLVQAMIEVESRFNPQARSNKGAAGLMQLMPDTARRYGVTDRFDTLQNLEAGIRYLKDLLSQHQGNVALALAAYNAGAGAVGKHGQRIPPYRETMLYVPAVLVRLQAGVSPSSPPQN
jgi:soluble lytic murein transglycosylase-like protein